MKRILLLIVMLCLSQLFIMLSAWGLYEYGRGFFPQLHAGYFLVTCFVLADGFLLALFKLPRHWRFKLLISFMVAIFYGSLFTLLGATLATMFSWLTDKATAESAVRFFIPVFMLVLVAYGLWSAYCPKIVRYSIKLQKPMPQAVHIAFLSDTHFGYLIGHRHIKWLQKAIQAESPDLILHGGDFMADTSRVYERRHMAKALRQVQAPLGKYAILGNHDVYQGQQTLFQKDIEAAGFVCLRDETINIQGEMLLTGRKDLAETRLAAKDCIKHALLPVVVLDHQPEGAKAIAQQGADLILAGHTHNGQLFPGTALLPLFQKYTYGHYFIKGSQLIVSAGLGLWGLPFRIGTRAELVIIELSGSL
ncbi:metallophosphoesterase [Brackiella oedipodis]|uniref:metallophosphoesterase n=1 Tax=Brackiella oedipodis TaxID=124225 RepID=UPI00049051FA|nr:metallophosphoesterase [Brackiella oedipodis]